MGWLGLLGGVRQGARPAGPSAAPAPGRSASRRWSALCPPGPRTAPRCGRSPTRGSRRPRTGGCGTEDQVGQGPAGVPGDPTGPGAPPGAGRSGEAGAAPDGLQILERQLVEGDPLGLGHEHGFPGGLVRLAERHLGRPAWGAPTQPSSAPCSARAVPHAPHPRPGTSPSPPTAPQPPHTHPFADQVVGEVSGQHVRTKSPCHVVPVYLGDAGRGAVNPGDPGGEAASLPPSAPGRSTLTQPGPPSPPFAIIPGNV